MCWWRSKWCRQAPGGPIRSPSGPSTPRPRSSTTGSLSLARPGGLPRCAGLGLGGRIPPRVEQKAVVGLGEVQPEPTGLEADQENRCVPLLESLNHGCTVTGSPVEIAVGDSLCVESIADPAEETGELTE